MSLLRSLFLLANLVLVAEAQCPYPVGLPTPEKEAEWLINKFKSEYTNESMMELFSASGDVEIFWDDFRYRLKDIEQKTQCLLDMPLDQLLQYFRRELLTLNLSIKFIFDRYKYFVRIQNHYPVGVMDILEAVFSPVMDPNGGIDDFVVPKGSDNYTSVFKDSTLSFLNFQQINGMLLAEGRELADRISHLKYEKDLGVYVHTLVAHESNYFDNEKEMRQEVEKLMDEILQKIDLVVKNSPKARRKNQLLPLMLRYGVPGLATMLKYDYFAENPLMDEKLTTVGWPSNWTVTNGFQEGWLLYAQTLGADMGLYESNLEKYGLASVERLQTACALVDIGINGLGWSKESAKEIMKSYTYVSDDIAYMLDIDREVNKVIEKPGICATPKIGEIRLKMMRKTVENRLGSINLPEFHYQLFRLQPMPLDVVEFHIFWWLKQVEAGKMTAGSTVISPLNALFLIVLFAVYLLYN